MSRLHPRKWVYRRVLPLGLSTWGKSVISAHLSDFHKMQTHTYIEAENRKAIFKSSVTRHSLIAIKLMESTYPPPPSPFTLDGSDINFQNYDPADFQKVFGNLVRLS